MESPRIGKTLCGISVMAFAHQAAERYAFTVLNATVVEMRRCLICVGEFNTGRLVATTSLTPGQSREHPESAIIHAGCNVQDDGRYRGKDTELTIGGVWVRNAGRRIGVTTGNSLVTDL